MLPHPSLATLFIMSEREQREKGRKMFLDNGRMNEVARILMVSASYNCFDLGFIEGTFSLFKHSSDFPLSSFLMSAGCWESKLK